MEKLKQIFRSLYLRLLTFLAFLYMAEEILAQTPTHYPTGKDPMQFNLVNILLFIVFPVLLVVLWIVIRRRGAGKDGDEDKG